MSRNYIVALVCIGVVGIIYALTRASHDLARARWNERGSDNYTLVVLQRCTCKLEGEYRITVEGGEVTDFILIRATTQYGMPGEPQGRLVIAFTPRSFQPLTVSAMLEKAKTQQVNTWMSIPAKFVDTFTYDETYGYITSYISTPKDSQYSQYTRLIYSARDLVLTGGAP